MSEVKQGNSFRQVFSDAFLGFVFVDIPFICYLSSTIGSDKWMTLMTGATLLCALPIVGLLNAGFNYEKNKAALLVAAGSFPLVLLVLVIIVFDIRVWWFYLREFLFLYLLCFIPTLFGILWLVLSQKKIYVWLVLSIAAYLGAGGYLLLLLREHYRF